MRQTRAKTVPHLAGVRGKRGGLTLVELILAMAITAMVCTAIAAMMKSVADTWQTNNADNEVFTDVRIALSRIRRTVENARLLGYSDSQRVVLWSGDNNRNLQIDYIECMMIQYEPTTEQLQLMDIYFPAGTPQSEIDARDISLDPTDFGSGQLATTLSQDQYCRVRTLVSDVKWFSLTLDVPWPETRSIVLDFKLQSLDDSMRFHAVVSLREPTYYLLE